MDRIESLRSAAITAYVASIAFALGLILAKNALKGEVTND